MTILDRLTRATNSRNFIPEIDGFRFFAIITVLMMHLNISFSRITGYDYTQGLTCLASLGWFLNRGGIGVPVFFSISGFILGMPFIRYYINKDTSILYDKPSLKKYYLRRLTRLEPPFIIAILGFFILESILSIQTPGSISIGHLLSTIFYSHCLIYNDWSTINPVTWSLETEVQFYILAPFLCKWLFSSGKKAIPITVTMMSIVLLLSNIFHIEIDSAHLGYSIVHFLPYFMVGFLVAYIYLNRKNFLDKKSILFDFVGLVSIFMLFYFAFGYFWPDLGFVVFLFLLFISVFKGKYLNQFFTSKLIYVIGGMCYTIYLLHYPFFYFICKFTAPLAQFDSHALNYLIQLVVVIPILLVVCSIFYLLIEKPCMDKTWPQKLWAFIRK